MTHTYYGYSNTGRSESILTFDDLKGQHLLKVVYARDPDALVFYLTDGRTFLLYHDQNCCESVTIEDICGDLTDLTGEILLAEESTSTENPNSTEATTCPGQCPVPNHYDDFQWTFYRIGTIKGTVVIRWYGTSNGYYSISVNFVEYFPEGRPRP